MGQMQTEANGSLLLFVNLTHTHTHARTNSHCHTHTHTHAHKFKKCNIPLTEMTIYWWFLLFAIYFNSARKCIADVTPCAPCAPTTCHAPRRGRRDRWLAASAGKSWCCKQTESERDKGRERERGETGRQWDSETSKHVRQCKYKNKIKININIGCKVAKAAQRSSSSDHRANSTRTELQLLLPPRPTAGDTKRCPERGWDWKSVKSSPLLTAVAIAPVLYPLPAHCHPLILFCRRCICLHCCFARPLLARWPNPMTYKRFSSNL